MFWVIHAQEEKRVSRWNTVTLTAATAATALPTLSHPPSRGAPATPSGIHFFTAGDVTTINTALVAPMAQKNRTT